jgi:hypothetical protein
MNERYKTSIALDDPRRMRQGVVGLAAWLFSPWARSHGGHDLDGVHAHAWEIGAWTLAAVVAASLVVWLFRRR